MPADPITGVTSSRRPIRRTQRLRVRRARNLVGYSTDRKLRRRARERRDTHAPRPIVGRRWKVRGRAQGALKFARRFNVCAGVTMGASRRRFCELLAAAVLPITSRPASALDYPTRPVRIIVGFPPGGPTDIFARLISEWLSNRLGQAFIVENRPGSGSTIGIAAVVAATPDGYTLLLVSTSAAISAGYYRNLSFDLVHDIVPICGVALEPLVMVVHPSVSAKTIPEFIADAKTNPGKIIMASVGNGTTPQMTGELFKMMAGVDLLPRSVPGRGTGSHRSFGWPSPGHVRSDANSGRLYTIRQTARFRRFNGDPVTGVSGYSHNRRIRPGL